MANDVLFKAREIIARELAVDIAMVSPEKRLRDDLKMDSILALNLIFAAERELHITIQEKDIVGVVTVADLESLVLRLATSKS